MGKTSSKVKDRYNQKAYDEIKVRVPKGFKAAVSTAAQARGESVNGYINDLLTRDMKEMGFDVEQCRAGDTEV